MSNKIRDKLMDYVMTNSTVSNEIQEKPYTAIEMVIGIRGETYLAHGFSKVKWPDNWDEEFGYNLACQKAASKIVKQLFETKDYIHLLEEIDSEKV